MKPSKRNTPTSVLRAYAQDESTRIEILDGNLRPVALEQNQNLGSVTVNVQPGVYSVRFHQGRRFTEKLAAVLPAAPPLEVRLDFKEQPEFATAAPLRNTSTTHEWQAGPAGEFSRSPTITPPGQKGGSHLLLFARNPFTSGDPPEGITVHDLAGAEIFDLSHHGRRESQQQWIGAHLNLDAGAYRLRRPIEGSGSVEQTVFTRPGWQTQVFLMRAERCSAIARTSILMARAGVGFSSERDDLRWTESALHALESNRNIPASIRSEMMWAKFENPMLGIYAGLLHLRRQQIDAGLVREVFRNLLSLAGPVPDVLAIGWALALRHPPTRNDHAFMTALTDAAALSVPPMLQESWTHLLRADAAEPQTIPDDSLAARIGGRLLGGGPWTVWQVHESADRDARAPSAPAVHADEESKHSATMPAFMAEATLATEAATAGEAGKREGGLSRFLGNLFDGLIEGGSKMALRPALSKLADVLHRSPEARLWIQSKRFSDLERRLSRWLDPTLDPSLTPLLEADAQLARRLRASVRARTADETALLTSFNITSGTALRTAWGIFHKLVIAPVLPLKRQLEDFVREESRGHSSLGAILSRLRRQPSRFIHPRFNRSVNLLEFARLYYRGSPAQPSSAGLDALATLLDSEGFTAGDARKVTEDQLAAEQAELRQGVIRALRRGPKKVRDRLPSSWETLVFPPRSAAVLYQLFPPFTDEILPTSEAASVPRPLPEQQA